MPRTLNKLTSREVAARIKPGAGAGRFGDGGGLSLVVTDDGRARWVFRYQIGGKSRDMGLGAAREVTLADARSAAEAARRALREGRDPIEQREEQRRVAQSVPTFGAVADEMLATIESGFRNEKHRAQWRMTLSAYAAPLTNKTVDTITTDEVLAVLKPIWNSKSETASRLRGRIERVLDYAAARGNRREANPARWRGHLDKLLPKRAKLTRGHHAAMKVDDLPAFVARLRQVTGTSARALEFAILTAARSGEVIGARWNEIDMEAKVWVIPARRMKAGREHRVPLSAAALAILEHMLPLRSAADGLVFPGKKADRPLSVMALSMALRRLAPDVTVHGFRSTFRDWAGDRTTFAREIAEAALAHVVGDNTERAYRRSDALDKRRILMDAWAQFAEARPADVISIRREAARG